MFRPAIYFVLGLILLGAVGRAESRGWMLWGPTRVHGVPRSIRDNPGAYRSAYRSSPRYFGGK